MAFLTPPRTFYRDEMREMMVVVELHAGIRKGKMMRMRTKIPASE